MMFLTRHTSISSSIIRVVWDSFSIQGGYMETCLLAGDEPNRPTAIFALSYTIVLGVMKAHDEMGLLRGDESGLNVII